RKSAEKGKELLLRKKHALTKQHRETRQALTKEQENRQQKETIRRMERLPKGLGGLWARVTGKYSSIHKNNEQEAKLCLQSDCFEKQALINHQLSERQNLQTHICAFKENYDLQMQDLRRDIARYINMDGTLPPPRHQPEQEQHWQWDHSEPEM
ncbi:MAG: hypothetical protein KAS59_02080, partial [Alphaproteobacteria bacterium]|nr:hypothetical protein [Alphaproteobacteria bacterium]